MGINVLQERANEVPLNSECVGTYILGPWKQTGSGKASLTWCICEEEEEEEEKEEEEEDEEDEEEEEEEEPRNEASVDCRIIINPLTSNLMTDRPACGMATATTLKCVHVHRIHDVASVLSLCYHTQVLRTRHLFTICVPIQR